MSKQLDMNPSERLFAVSIDEIRQNFVLDTFRGSFKITVTLSDGSVRNIELTPKLKDDGSLVVEFDDNGRKGRMGPCGTTVHGQLMISIKEWGLLHPNEPYPAD